MDEDIKLALEYVNNKNFKAAENIYLKIIKRDKSNITALSLLGLLYYNIKLYDKAEKYLEKSIAIKETPSIIESLAYVKFYLKKYGSACKYFSQVLQVNESFDIYDKYVNSLMNVNIRSYTKAYNYALECFQKYPFKKEAQYNLAIACFYKGKIKETLNLARELVIKYPKYGLGWYAYGLGAELLIRDNELIIYCFKNALRFGEKGIGYYNLARYAIYTGEYKKALRYIKKLYFSSTSLGEVYYMTSVVYFKQRKFKTAFRYYMLKEVNTDFKEKIHTQKPFWNGKRYKNETLLLYCDQDFGDNIMFSRYIPFLKTKFKHIDVYTYGEMIKLFKRSFADCKNISVHKHLKRPKPHDKFTIISDMPRLLKMDKGVFPLSSGYLYADKLKIEKYKQNYFNDIKNSKIGIVWEAGGIARGYIQRTLNIKIFEPILNLDGIQYYSCQFKPRTDDYKKYSNLIELGSTFKDFDDTAAALMNLDLLITVDTSVAHLAGALGVKTFMLVPAVSDWRWFDCTDKCDWYDSVKIFKQTNPASWEDVVQRIKNYVLEMLMHKL